LDPINGSKTHSIEKFWGELINKVYLVGWKTTNRNQLKGRIKNKMKEVDRLVIQNENMTGTLLGQLGKMENVEYSETSLNGHLVTADIFV
jgi:hypothetical protein